MIINFFEKIKILRLDILKFFSRKSQPPKFDFFNFSRIINIALEIDLDVIETSENVRLKGLDRHFEKKSKKSVLPHFPLISVVFEEGRKSQFFAFFRPQSFLKCYRNQREVRTG